MPLALARLLHSLRRLADTPGPAPDAVLLERFALQRDEAAFAALLARHGPMVYRACRRTLPDAGAAEDAFQATFLILARKAASLRRPASLAGWLYGVALRVALKARKLGARRRAQEAPLAEGLAGPCRDPLAEVSARELLDALEDEVRRLPEAYRMPVVLCCVEGLSQEEAADRLGCTPGSVRGRLERGRKRLHLRLVKRGFTLPAALAAVALSRGGVGAGMPAALAAATARAALTCAAGGPGTTCGLAARADELARTALPAAGPGKLRLAVVLALALGVAGSGAGVLSQPQAPPPGDAKAALGAPARPKAAAGKPARTDRQGDPLPPRAIVRLGTVRFRHDADAAGALAYSPDGRILAANTEAGVVLWDATSGREQHRLPVAPYRANCDALAFSPDSSALAVAPAGPGEPITFWDTRTGRKLRGLALSLKGPGSHRPALRYGPNGRYLAVAPPGGAPLIVDVASGEARSPAGTEGLHPHALAFGRDGKLMLLATDSGPRAWDVSAGKVTRPGGPDWTTGALAVSADGKAPACGGKGRISLYDLPSMKELARLEAAMGWVPHLAFTPDGRTLVSHSHDAKIRLWDVATGKARAVWPRPRGGYPALAPDGKSLALNEGGQSIRLLDVATGRERPVGPQGHDRPVTCLAFTPDGRALFGGGDQATRQWDTTTWAQVRLLPHSMMTLSLSADGRHLAVVPYFDKQAQLYEVASGRPARVFRMPEATEVQRAHYFPGGHRLVTSEVLTGGRPGEKGATEFATRLRLWDAASGEQLGQQTLPSTIPEALAPCPDGRAVIVEDRQPGLAVYDLERGGEGWRFTGPAGRARALALSADGGVLVSADDSRLVQLWEVVSGQEVFALQGHRHPVRAVAISPDGRVAASGDLAPGPSEERGALSVRLWDVATGAEVGRLGGHAAGVTALAFAPDGKRLAAGLADGTVLVWDVQGMAAAPRRGSRPLTQTELEALWADLGGRDGRKAHRAVGTLAGAGPGVVPLLRQRLRPAAAVDEAQVKRWVAEADSPRFTERQAAVQRLEGLGDQAAPALARALKGELSLEARRRLEGLLRKCWGVPNAATLRALRAVRVLEQTGTAEARGALEWLAGGAPEARLTREAQAALERLARRPAAAR